MHKTVIFTVIIRIVTVLLYYIIIRFISSFILSFFINLDINKAFLIAYIKDNNLASVIKVVTVSYLKNRYLITPLNSLIT